MLNKCGFQEIYIACVYTDLRYGIDNLAATVKEIFGLKPFSPRRIFLFCGRRNDRIKTLVWADDGFLLLCKGFEAGKFKLTKSGNKLQKLTYGQFTMLMIGVF